MLKEGLRVRLTADYPLVYHTIKAGTEGTVLWSDGAGIGVPGWAIVWDTGPTWARSLASAYTVEKCDIQQGGQLRVLLELLLDALSLRDLVVASSEASPFSLGVANEIVRKHQLSYDKAAGIPERWL